MVYMMKKSKSRQQTTTCNLKQTDICTYIRNMQVIKKEKDEKKMVLSSEIIVVRDSDSESESPETETSLQLPKLKRPLSVPFSDDEDGQDTTVLKKITRANVFPKIKRPLPYSFSDEDTGDEDDHAGFNNKATPNKSHSSSVCPIACSTPHSNHSSDLNTHVSLEDVLNISQIDNCNNSQNMNEEQSLTNKRKIQILQNTIIPSNSSFYRNTTVIAEYSGSTTASKSPSKRICMESGKHTSTLETNDTNNNGSSSSSSATNTNEANMLDKLPKDKVAKQKDSWLSKENRPDCNMNKRKSESAIEEVTKKANVSETLGPKVIRKDKTQKNRDKEKRLIETDKTLKVSSKENVSTSKDKGNKSDRNELGEKKTESRSKCDKTASGSSSPKKSLDVRNSSPSKSSELKKEEKKINKELLILLTDLFRTVLSSGHVNSLLETERGLIKHFFSMENNHQYACLKLMTRKKRWYNAFKFCRLIHLDMEETDVCDMVKILEQKEIVDTDYTNESVTDLLKLLDNVDLRGICDKFKVKKTLKTKDEMIRSLLQHSNTQSTLFIRKSTKDLLLEEIQRRMGRCIKVSQAFQNAFHSTFSLATFTNPSLLTIQDYFNLKSKNIIFPIFPIDNYTIFSSSTDFTRYIKARRYREELEVCPDHVHCLQVCKTIFTELMGLENDKSDIERFQDAPHLIQFTAKAVYVSTLSFMAEKLFRKFPKEVKVWLEYMIRKVDCPRKIGHWYYWLIWLYMRYLKPFDYDRAAMLLFKVLHKEREHLSEIQLYKLRERGEQLFCTRKYKIQQMNHDLIAQLLPKRIKVKSFPETTIDAKCLSKHFGQRHNTYEIRDSEGNKTILKVEDIALKYYVEKLRYTSGEHCEGAIIKALFTLFFFDIIYSARNSIPGTFVSKIQSEPLDMNSRHFYPNRKEQIDRRLTQIESEWSDDELMIFVKNKYENHSHEYCLCEVGVVIENVELLQTLVECIGRKLLAKIFGRLVQNYREYRSGLPDLLVWNVDKKTCKFVEVKSEDDKLSIGQTLWMNYLLKIGADAELCHVHSIGCKKKVKRVDSNDALEASTPSCSH